MDPHSSDAAVTAFRVDDKFHDHPKVRKLGDDQLVAVGLWTLCGSWTSGRAPAGFVPTEVVQRFDRKERYARRLVEVGLWCLAEVDGETGYRFYQWNRNHTGDWRPRISNELRESVYARDHYCCQHCGSSNQLTLDHIYPWILGGEDTFENLQTLCGPCNSRKGARV
jgi:hypothetical protein